jgi:hypothetical protein
MLHYLENRWTEFLRTTGYQIIKKWLSYREQPFLGRPITKDEVRYVQEMARTHRRNPTP